MTDQPAVTAPARLAVFTLLFRAESEKGRFSVSYEVVAEDAEEAARLALQDFAARGERVTDVDRAETYALANPLTPKGVVMRVGCSYFMRAA